MDIGATLSIVALTLCNLPAMYGPSPLYYLSKALIGRLAKRR